LKMSKQGPNRAKFGMHILAVARLWRRAADQALDDCGLSHATAMPLLTLSRLGDNVRQGVIADQLGLEGPSLVRVVDLLLAEGLVTRAEDRADRRAKILSLTKAGRARVAEIEDILARLRAELLADVGDEELDAMVGVLKRLEEKLLAREAESDT
jgi:MarR family transcriptional regulator for hemolysin